MSEFLYSSENENSDYEKWSNLGGENQKNPSEGWDSLKNFERVDTLPSPEEKVAKLSFDSLAELSTNEYIKLWRELNPFYTTHVTRQGVRDHDAIMEHSGGLGEFHDSFRAILEDKKELCSPAEASYSLPVNFTEDDVAGVLEELVFSTHKYDDYSPEDIINVLPMNLSFASSDPWGDINAVHFAQHTVLDEVYGGESGNEIFFVFPTDVIASQCRYGGSMHGAALNTAQVDSEEKWNDLHVWSDSGRIPIDAGLVFLPKNQMVDSKTGSKYATAEITDEAGNTTKVPQKDEERIERFKDWLLNTSRDAPEFMAISKDRDYSLLENKLKAIGIPENCLEGMTRFGNEYELMGFIENRGKNSHLLRVKEQELSDDERLDLLAHRYLEVHNADLKVSENLVRAENYWEDYFTVHPEQKPAHIIYYDGEPSKAVRNFLAEQGILKEIDKGYGHRNPDDHEQRITGPGDTVKRDGKMLGFEKNYVADIASDAEMSAEHQRFNEIALAILRQVK